MDDDDDYWNTSETKAKAFSFDDDVLSPQEILAIGQNQSSPGQAEDSMFSGTSISNVKTVTLPVSNLVSPKVLELILLAQSGKDPKASPESEQTVAVTIKRLVLGRPCSLHGHRSLRSKTELLDAAVAVGDGNAILTLAQSGKDRKASPESEQTMVTIKRLVLGRPCSLHGHRSLRSKTQLLDAAVAVGDGNAILTLAQSGKDPKASPESEQTMVTIKRLVLGRPCSLHGHRSLRSKTQLLDAAVAVGDGNAILTVVLFLIQTLNKKLVYELLSSRPSVLSHYISFLQNEGKISELTDLLTMLGRSPDAAMHQFQQHMRTQGGSVDGLLRKVTNLVANHFNQPGIDAHQAKMLADFVKLLEWQKFAQKPVLENKSALYCLAYCCANHWHEGAGNMMSPLTLCQRQQISPLQYDWVVLNVHAKSGKWDIVESLFTKKDWLGRTTVSSHIPIETLLSRLSEMEASKQLLATCVNKVAASHDRLRLAQMFKIHSVVIETYAKQKDRLALQNYKMTLIPQSEDFILVENTLRDNSIKWKN